MPTALAYTSFTFQVQDNGGTANGGVNLDPIAQDDHRQRHLGQRRPGGTNKTVTTLEDTAYTFATGRLRLQRSQRHAGQQLCWP